MILRTPVRPANGVPGELQQHIDENEALAEGFILSQTYNGDTAMIWRTS